METNNKREEMTEKSLSMEPNPSERPGSLPRSAARIHAGAKRTKPGAGLRPGTTKQRTAWGSTQRPPPLRSQPGLSLHPPAPPPRSQTGRETRAEPQQLRSGSLLHPDRRGDGERRADWTERPLPLTGTLSVFSAETHQQRAVARDLHETTPTDRHISLHALLQTHAAHPGTPYGMSAGGGGHP